MASELDLEGRMYSVGFDPTYTLSQAQDNHLRFLTPEFGIGTGIMAEVAARHSIGNLDPTSNLMLLEFILRVPDEQCRILC